MVSPTSLKLNDREVLSPTGSEDRSINSVVVFGLVILVPNVVPLSVQDDGTNVPTLKSAGKSICTVSAAVANVRMALIVMVLVSATV